MFPLWVRGQTWFGFPKKWFLSMFKKASKTSVSTHLLRPKYGFLKFSKCRQFQKCFKVMIVCFCASPMSLFLFLLSLLFILSLIMMIFFLVFVWCLMFSCIYIVLTTWAVFVFVVLLLIYVFSSCSCCLFPCCSSLVLLHCFVAFECKQQQARSNETQALRITKKHVLKLMTFANIQESKNSS